MKAHLKDSTDPITEGTTVTANCGEIVPNALFVFAFDELDQMTQPETLRGICNKCKLPWEKRMRYGILNGQEAMSSEEGQ